MSIRTRSKRTLITCLSALALALMTSCDGAESADASSGEAPAGAAKIPYRIVATTSMIADVARNVAQGRAEVIGLLGEGVDPHTYKLTRSDTATLMSADVVLYNGLLLEGKMTDALMRVAVSGKPVYAVTEILDERFLLEPPEFNKQYDPHVWMDPSAWAKVVEAIRDKLTEYDGAGAAAYAANTAAYNEELLRLDAYAEGALESVPSSGRVLVTAHDAFNYFGKRFGYEVLGIQGISTESEAGVREIEALVDIIVERKIPAVFVETTISDRNVRALIAGARDVGFDVVIGGKLFSDAMGAPGTYEGTYIGMIDHNVTTITRALGGDAPADGMNGRLAGAEH